MVPTTKQQKDPTLEYLQTRQENLLAAVPQALQGSVTWTSIIQGIGLALEKSKNLRDCNPRTIYASVLYGLRLGLDPSGQTGEFALVPYKGVCVGQVMAYGKLRLAYRFGGIKAHVAQVVHENDTIEFDAATNTLKHSWTFGRDRGRPIGAYFRYWRKASRDASADGMELMDITEFEKIRDTAKAKNNGKLSPAYAEWPDEMFKRSVISRGCKHIDKSPELMKVEIAARDEYAVEARGPYIDVVVDETGTALVDTSTGEVVEEKKPVPQPRTVLLEEGPVVQPAVQPAAEPVKRAPGRPRKVTQPEGSQTAPPPVAAASTEPQAPSDPPEEPAPPVRKQLTMPG